jgi:hypothetical protein
LQLNPAQPEHETWGSGALLQYDFDILRSDRVQTLESQPRAVFRNAETRAAVLTLPESARNWLAHAGFVDRPAAGNLPPEFYAPQDEPYRLQIMQRLTASMKEFDLARAGADTWSDFVIADFVDAIARSRPAPVPQDLAEATPAPQIPSPFAGLRGKEAKDALAKAAPRRWHPKPTGMPFGMLALARRQGFVKLSLGTMLLYCAVLLYLNR